MDNELNMLNQAIEKAYQSTSNQPAHMAIAVDDEIHSKTFDYSPFLAFLDKQGQCQDVTNANVSFFKETPQNVASFIGETADLPDYAVTNYEEVVDRMKTVASGFKVSMMSQMGTDYVDLLQTEIRRGYLNVSNTIDKTLLQGDSSQNSLEFDAVTTEIPEANIIDNEGASITEDAVDTLLTTIVEENDGHPDVIVTDSYVAKQLKAIVAPYRRYNDKVDIGLGHRVTTYEGMDGVEIPILIDKNVPSDADDHKLLALDSTTIKVKYLMRPSLFADLPATNLSYNQAVASFVTAMNLAPWKNGVISGIGE